MSTNKKSSQAVLSFKVHLAFLSAYHAKVQNRTWFSHPASKSFFLRGCLFSSQPSIVPQWSLSVVLSQLLLAPFDPLGSYGWQLLSFKIVFLIVIVSVTTVGQLAAWRTNIHTLRAKLVI